MGTPGSEPGLSIGLLVLRVGTGGYLLTHGWGKLGMLLDGQFAAMGDPIGLGSHASLVLVTLSEFLCALLVIVGLATRLAAAIVVVSMAVAAFVVHGGEPWTMESAAILFMEGKAESWASKEPALLYLIPSLALVFTGAGRTSIDRWIGSRRRSQGEPTGAEGSR